MEVEKLHFSAGKLPLPHYFTAVKNNPGEIKVSWDPDRQPGEKPRLKGPPKPSYPSLRPRGRRGDDRDPEPPAASGEPGAGVPVGGFVPPGRLPVFEDRPAVGAEGLRDAVFPQDLPEHPAMCFR